MHCSKAASGVACLLFGTIAAGGYTSLQHSQNRLCRMANLYVEIVYKTDWIIGSLQVTVPQQLLLPAPAMLRLPPLLQATGETRSPGMFAMNMIRKAVDRLAVRCSSIWLMGSLQ